MDKSRAGWWLWKIAFNLRNILDISEFLKENIYLIFATCCPDIKFICNSYTRIIVAENYRQIFEKQ